MMHKGKPTALILAILGYSEVDIEVSDIGVKTMKFGEYKELSNRVTNRVLL